MRASGELNPNSEKHFFTDAYGADAGASSVGFANSDDYILVVYEIIEDVPNCLRTKIKGTGQNQFISNDLQNFIKEIARE